MPRIPDVTDLGQRRVPRSATGVVRNRAGEIFGRALEEVGDTVQRAQDQRRERERNAEDRLQLAQAKRDVLMADSEISSTLNEDGDYATFDKRYSEHMAKARESAATRIQNKESRELFLVDTDMTVSRGRESVRRVAWDKEVREGRRQTGVDVDAMLDGALRSPDSRIRAEFLSAIGERVDAVGVDGKRYFTAAEAEELKQTTGARYAVGWLESLPLKDQVSALEKVHGTAAAMLPEPERSQRLSHAKERLQIEEDRTQREAEMSRRIAMAESREALRDSEADAFAARAVGMTDAALPPRAMYLAAYGNDGAERYDRVARRFSVYDAVSTAVELPPDQATKMLSEYKPVAQLGAADAAEVQRAAISLYQQQRKALETDPAAGIIARDAQTRDLYTEAANGDAGAAVQYVARVRSRAAAMGLAPRILPKAATERLALELTFDPDKPGKRTETLQALREQWGRHYPQVIREIAPKLEGDARIVAAMRPQAAKVYDSVVAQGGSKVIGLLDTDKKRDVQKYARQALGPFIETVISNPDAEARINEHIEAVQLLAASMVNRGVPPGDAAERAADMVVRERYQFRDSLRVPVGLDADRIASGAEAIKASIRPADLAVKSRPTATMDQSQNDLAALIRKEGAWFTLGDETGAELRVPVNGRMLPVTLSTGKPVRRTWGELREFREAAESRGQNPPIGVLFN